MGINKTKSMLRYDEFGFEETRIYLVRFSKLKLSGMDRGLGGLLAARTGGFLTGVQAAERGLIRVTFKIKCPCCGCVGAESLEHLFLECDAWGFEREEFLNLVSLSKSPFPLEFFP